MSDLGLQLVDGLLFVARAQETDKAILRDFFEQHFEGQNGRVLASQVLATVLTHISADDSVTDLHRHVLTNLITVLGNGTHGAGGHAAPATVQRPQVIHEAGGHEVAQTYRSATPKAPKGPKGPKREISTQTRPAKKEQSQRASPGGYSTFQKSDKEQEHALRRKKFLDEVCGKTKMAAWDITVPNINYVGDKWGVTMPQRNIPSPTSTQRLEQQRGSSTKPFEDVWSPGPQEWNGVNQGDDPNKFSW
ncbi:uncharacterized protein GGS22DRAFT_182997 [Annulohypoxylon maeteangense]|uniref:uncharacterized protein n=1 Tax=Annulohypoxylon maeteangense TaxID=1927788 RepID=UPI0020071FCB|nr:uncharacterized protein GGS22DRAFT_182997 [Annulohypoxylon maeteangense]KAI0889653.1 hypothetical protein GGS22DRAFT_182997 [Annulohypoxylon maeteangense]